MMKQNTKTNTSTSTTEVSNATSKTVLRAGKNFQEAVAEKLNASKGSEAHSWVTICPAGENKHARKNAAKSTAPKTSLNNSRTLIPKSRTQTAAKPMKLQASCNCGKPDCPTCNFCKTFPTLVDGCQSVCGFLFNKPDNISGSPALYIAYYDSFENLVIVSRVDTVNDGGVFTVEDMGNIFAVEEEAAEEETAFEWPDDLVSADPQETTLPAITEEFNEEVF